MLAICIIFNNSGKTAYKKISQRGSNMKKLLVVFVILMVVGVVGCTAEEDLEQEESPENQENQQVEVPEPEDMIVDPEEWKEEFPREYQSYMMTSRT